MLSWNASLEQRSCCVVLAASWHCDGAHPTGLSKANPAVNNTENAALHAVVLVCSIRMQAI